MFVQITDLHTSRMDEGMQLANQWRADTDGRNTVQRSLMCQDREDPEHYMLVAFFDSYEAAMQNSNMPETGELASKLGSMQDRAPSYIDLDVVDDWT